ncbi:hypothetical protein ACFV7R_03885 [Streptomyces sp. NPDC059866]|uniref:hypothetical protein n=1 Tax=Streptomyces sp. NPDC059866 TaxID=3346978 RepID=UPI00364CABA4
MPSRTSKIVTAAGVVLGVATGIVTNLITSRWSWSLAATLAVLVVVAVVIALRGTGGTQGSGQVRVRAHRGGSITDSGITVRNGAVAEQLATRRGRIRNSPVISRGADTAQQATRGGEIEGSPLDAGP